MRAAPDDSAAAERAAATSRYTEDMKNGHRIAEIAALIADPSRAGMLAVLLDGSARPAGELAHHVHVTRATASEHLARLLALGLVSVEPQGRHRYFRLAGPQVAAALESLAQLTAPPPKPLTPAAVVLRRARLCWGDAPRAVHRGRDGQ